MKTRTFNFLPVFLMALGIVTGFTACEEKGDDPVNQSIIGIWNEVYEGTQWDDGRYDGTDVDRLFAFHFKEDNQVTWYACYYQGEVEIADGTYTYDPDARILTMDIPDAQFVSSTFSCEIMDDEMRITLEYDDYLDFSILKRISNEELHAKINEAMAQE